MNMDVINSICNCIKVLCDSQHAALLPPSTTKTDAFVAHLKNNINLMLSELKAQPKLLELLKIYESYMVLDSDNNVEWNFVTWCLILLNVLQDSLTSTVNPMKKTGGPILSISQQKAIENCLQFIIVLGVLPNLLPGVGISLRNRTKYANVVKHARASLCPRTKYKRLVICIAVLLTCTSHIVLQSIIITRHAGDLLAALFQLCYAPIKKLKDHEQHISSKNELPKPCGNQAPDGSCKKKLHLHKKFADMLKEVTDSCEWTETQLIKEMWDDRPNFMTHFDILLQKICPDVLIWELVLLQGINYIFAKEVSQAKTPMWLRKLCNQMLVEQLVKPHGLKLFIRIMLDKTTDTDLKEGAVDKAKVDAVARLISINPVHNMSLEEYIKSISTQVIDLLHSREENMEFIFNSVASAVILQLAEINQPLTEKYIFRNILKELSICIDKTEISRFEEGNYLVKEDALTVCIEDMYKIFVHHGVPSQQNTFSLLLPFYHLLFIMFYQTQSGVSFLRPLLKGLMVSLVKSFSTSDALILLRLASFEDVEFHPVQYVTDVKCVLGDSGGIVLMKYSQISSEDLLDDINKKCTSIITIIDEVSSKKLKVSYFLCLLKRLTELSVEDEMPDENFQTRHFRNNLILLQQLQEIAETVGEDLVEDIVEAAQFVKVILEKAVMAKNSEHSLQTLFGQETVVMSLVILGTIVECQNQLTSLHWKVVKECLPSLEKLVTSFDDIMLKNMCEDLIFAIATHGAAGNTKKSKRQSSAQKINTLGKFPLEKMSHTKKLPTSEILDPLSEEISHEDMKEGDLCEHPTEILNSSTTNTVMETAPSQNSTRGDNLDQMSTEVTASTQQGSCSTFKLTSEIVPNLPSDGKFSKTYSYESALKDLNDPVLPVRGHGLIILTRLINENNAEALAHKEDLLKIFMENLSDDDSYIYLASIQGLSALADVCTESVLPTVLKKFSDINEERTEVQLKLGEVLLKICKSLGEMTVKYRSEFIHAYLCGAKHKQAEIRASSLSNLGEVCKWLKFSLGTFLQEILICVLSLLKTDADMEVRRSAALVITFLLRGTGKDAFVVLENEMKELYSVLRHINSFEKDDVLKLHAQLALEEINVIVKDVLCSTPAFTKEIRVLDPF